MHIATARELTDLVNHPLIFPHMGAEMGQSIDMRRVYDNEGNIGLTTNCGGMLFAYHGDGVYDCHFLFIPGTCGKTILATARKMLKQMFTKYGARVIKGHPPRENRAVRVIGRSLGFIKIDTEDVIDELGRVCETYEIRGM